MKVITSNIIYKLIDDYEAWVDEKTKEQEEKSLEKLNKPFKARVMPGYIFRQSNPAVVGVEVMQGTMKANSPVMNIDGKDISRIKGIQLEQKNIDQAEKDKQVAVSLENVTVGRHIDENDILYSSISEDEFRKLKEHKKLLNNEEIELLKEIAQIKRKRNEVWGL